MATSIPATETNFPPPQPAQHNMPQQPSQPKENPPSDRSPTPAQPTIPSTQNLQAIAALPATQPNVPSPNPTPPPTAQTAPVEGKPHVEYTISLPNSSPASAAQVSDAPVVQEGLENRVAGQGRSAHADAAISPPESTAGSEGCASENGASKSSVEGPAVSSAQPNNLDERKSAKRSLPTKPDQTNVQNTADILEGSELKRRRTSTESAEAPTDTKPKQNAAAQKHPEPVPMQSEKPVSIDPGITSSESTPSSTSQPTLRAVPPSNSPGPMPANSVLPMLRSSPVFSKAGNAPVQSKATNTSGAKNTDSNEASTSNAIAEMVRSPVRPVPGGILSAPPEANADNDTSTWADDKPPKKQKTVSWAPDESLVDVQYIDDRAALVKSWDPESGITLPFQPSTLQMLQSSSEEQERAKNQPESLAGREAQHTIQARKISAFEAARKKEHDMEQERIRKAREELQNRLTKMVPLRSWVRPTEIVLPAECRIEPRTIQDFSVVDETYRNVASRRKPGEATPPSPPPELRSPFESSSNDNHVPYFPLSDGAGDGAEAGAKGDTMQTMGSGRQTNDHGYNNDLESTFRRYDDGNNIRQSHRKGGNGGLSNSHRSNFETQQHSGRRDGERQGAPRRNGLDSHFFDGGNGPVSQQTFQHLLSALQTSGLLNDTGGNHMKSSNNDNYSGDQHRMERDSRGDMYIDQQHTGNQNGSNGNMGPGSNMYVEDEKRHGDHEDGSISVSGSMGPPPPPPIMGHPGQLPGFPPNVGQSGMMDGFPFPLPPMPPGMGMPPSLMPLPMGMPMPPMGLGLPFAMPPGPMMNGPSANASKASASLKSGKGGPGRQVETISRPKSKGPKQRKRCKYFGTKQGCRDGNACIFAHI